MPKVSPIHTQRLLLREFIMDDWPAVHHYGSDPDVMKGLMLPPNTGERSQEVVKEIVAHQVENPRNRYDLAITLATTREVIGSASIRLVWPRQLEASMGYVVRKDCWGQGYATEAGTETLRLGFELLEAHRVFAACDTENLGSVRVLEKLGMTREGMHRQNFWSPAHGGWRDTYYYAILENEWRKGSLRQ